MNLFGESQLQIQSKSKHSTITPGILEILFEIQLTKQVRSVEGCLQASTVTDEIT